jgi:hypothetical protein
MYLHKYPSSNDQCHIHQRHCCGHYHGHTSKQSNALQEDKKTGDFIVLINILPKYVLLLKLLLRIFCV